MADDRGSLTHVCRALYRESFYLREPNRKPRPLIYDFARY